MTILSEQEDLIRDYLWASLRSPVLCPSSRKDGSVLVEYRINPHKLGYLVARIDYDKVVVLTFLLLTMDGTPEGEELHRQLRLSRIDKAHLGLDDLKTFALTDVQKDAQLVSLLNKCGCGHLCECIHTKRNSAGRPAGATNAAKSKHSEDDEDIFRLLGGE